MSIQTVPADTVTPVRAAAGPGKRRGEARAGWGMAAPFLIFYLLFVIGPSVYGIVMSFFNSSLQHSGLGGFAGAGNYTEALASGDFWQSMWHTVLFTLMTAPPLVQPGRDVAALRPGAALGELPAVAVPIAVFIFVSFFNGIPSELAEAARVDGASWWHIYRRIYMPLSKPAISAVFIFTFVWKWNDFLWPLLTLTNTRIMTLPVGLSQVSSAFGIMYAEIMASAVLGALPLIVVFLLFQWHIVEGIATTGIK
jgi:ABC-type glycerol-3-phosphate transport system permease component